MKWDPHSIELAERLVKEPFFYGNSEHKISSKGQIAIPKRFRTVVPEEQREEGFVLLAGETTCIYMYTHRQFGVIKDRVRAVALQEQDPEFFRRFMEGAHAVDLDAQGRFVIPGELRDYADLSADVMFIGMDDRIEIWAPGVRAAHKGTADEYEQRRKQQAKSIFGL